MHPKMPLHSSFTRNPMLRSLRVARSIRIPTTFGITTFAADRCEPPTFSGCAADDVAPLTKMHAATADTITTAAVRIAPPSIRCPDLSDPTPAIVSAQPHDRSRSTRTDAVQTEDGKLHIVYSYGVHNKPGIIRHAVIQTGIPIAPAAKATNSK